jgi:hypothetical protein
VKSRTCESLRDCASTRASSIEHAAQRHNPTTDNPGPFPPPSPPNKKGAKFHYRFVKPHFRSAFKLAKALQSPTPMVAMAGMSSLKSSASALFATSLPFSVVKIPGCFEAPHVRAPLGAGLSMRQGVPRLSKPLKYPQPAYPSLAPFSNKFLK